MDIHTVHRMSGRTGADSMARRVAPESDAQTVYADRESRYSADWESLRYGSHEFDPRFVNFSLSGTSAKELLHNETQS